jgi:hypothetical protein
MKGRHIGEVPNRLAALPPRDVAALYKNREVTDEKINAKFVAGRHHSRRVFWG